ncbi:MAG TPA: GNAT family N-acetyltransferase [Acidimicrobiales bacterium]
MVVVEAVKEATPEIAAAITRLLPLLSQSAAPPTLAQVAEIVDSPTTTVFVARDGDGGEIVGTLTLVVFRIPSGIRAWIEDVIVAEEARGQGCGESLNRAALEAAQAAGARTVELTSRPSREAANRLYRRIGFVERETNVYRYTLEPDVP